MEKALCKDLPPDRFYGVDDVMTSEEIHRAKAVCAWCKATPRCLWYSFRTDEQWGVWGGLSAAERRKYLRMSNKNPHLAFSIWESVTASLRSTDAYQATA